MGSQTRGQLVTEALLTAGDPSLVARAQNALNSKLRGVYMSWPWPFLKARATGVPLGQGVQSINFGLGGSGVTLEVQRIIDPIFQYTSTFTNQSRPRIRPDYGGDLWQDEVVNNPATFIGQPSQFKVVAGSTWGAWILKPTPFPDKAYLLAIDYIFQPADIALGTSGDSVQPTYPNDETLKQIILTAIRKYQCAGDPSYQSMYTEAAQDLREMIVADRMRFGYAPGVNDQVGLDPAMFDAQVTPIIK